MSTLRKSEDYIKIFRNNSEEYHTLVFSIEQFDNLTVEEVIDELEQQLNEDCRSIIKGIRLTNKNCFITVNTPEQCKKLANAGLKIKDKPITLDNVWEKSTVLQLSAVPPHVLDEQIIAAISRFADIIGGIEQQTYKGFDTGERFIHVKSRDTIPGKLLLGSTCLDLSIVYPAVEVTTRPPDNNRPASFARRKSFRSQININLIPPQEEDAASVKSDTNAAATAEDSATDPKPEPSFFAKSTGITLTGTETKTELSNSPSSLTPPQPSTTGSIRKKGPPSPGGAGGNQQITDSPSSFRRFSQRRNNSGRRNNAADISAPPSPIPFHNSSRIIRKSSVNFKGNGSNNIRTPDIYAEYGSGYARERSTSETSSRQSICKRKLSVTGHEGSGKIPWCGCWGIGCC